MNGVPHHGQSSSGIGDGLAVRIGLELAVLRTGRVGAPVPLRPIAFGVAAFPTHRPISNGHVPYRPGIVLPLELERADQARSPRELVERQQPSV